MTEPLCRWLIVDDDETVLDALLDIGRGMMPDHEFLGASSYSQAERIIAETRLDGVLSDYNLGTGPTGVNLIMACHRTQPHIERFVVMSGLKRDVPDGIAFRLKDDFAGIMDTFLAPYER